MGRIVGYFDLLSAYRGPQAKAGGKQLHWLPQYIALVLGILIQPLLRTFQATHLWDFSGFTSWILFSLLVGLIVFPAAYKSSFEPDKPLFVQFCIILTSGMGWESLVKTVTG
ncbi:MAG: hypothetical protein WB699_13980 [Bacteroidota bacterium]